MIGLRKTVTFDGMILYQRFVRFDGFFSELTVDLAIDDMTKAGSIMLDKIGTKITLECEVIELPDIGDDDGPPF